MSIKSFTTGSGTMTKIRAEQIKAEIVTGGTLASDLLGIKEQVAAIAGAAFDNDYAADYSKVQIADLNVHLDASAASGAELLVLGGLDVALAVTASHAKFEDLNVAGGLVFADNSGNLDNDAKLAWDGSKLAVTGEISGSGALNVGAAAVVGNGLTVNGAAADFNAGVTANEIKIDGDTAQRLYIVGADGALKDEEKLVFDGSKLAVTGIVSGSAALQGASVAVDGAATIGNGMTVSGAVADFNAGVTANEIKIDGDTAQRLYIVGSTGEIKDESGLVYDGSKLAVTGIVSGSAALQGASLAVDGAATVGGNLTVTGDFTVNGTTTTVNSTTLTVDDKNIELGSVATPTDSTADGGGITLLGATNKTILWLDSTDAWTFNQHVHVSGEISGSGALKIAGAATLNGGLTVNAAVADFNAGITANEIKIDGDTANRLYMVGASGEIMDSSDLTYAAAQLSVVGAISGSGALLGERVDVDGGVQAGMIKIDGDVAQRLYIVDTDGSMKDESLMTFNGTKLAVTGQVSGSAQVSGASFLADGLGDMGTLRVRGQSQFQGLVKLDAGVADVSGSIIPSVNTAFNVGSGVRRYSSLFANTADLGGSIALDMARAGDQTFKKAGSGDLVMSSSVAAGFIKFDDAYRGATLLNSATAGLKLANSGEWATFAASFPTVDSILGAFNAIAAGGGAEKAFFVAAAGVAAETAVDVSAGTGMGDLTFAGLTKDNSMVFFNGQLLRSGSVAELAAPASADYSFDGGKTGVKFSFAVEVGDQLVVQKL